MTTLADVIVPEVFTPYVVERTAELTALIQAGVIVRDATMDRLVRGPGELIQMPFWKDLTGSDELVTSGGTVTIGGILTGKDQAQRLLRQKGFGAEDIADLLAGDDPLMAIGDLTAEYWARRFQQIVISLLTGVFSSASMSSLCSEIYQPGGTLTDANRLNGLTFIDAGGLLGDAAGRLTAVAMHSATERYLRGLDLIDFDPPSTGTKMLKTFQGYPMVVDDSLPVETVDGRQVYTTYLFGQGAIAYGENTDAKAVPGGIGDWHQELARVARGGTSEMITRRNIMLHPRGIKFTQAAMALETPTNAELATGTNWERVYNVKNIRAVRVRHNLAA